MKVYRDIMRRLPHEKIFLMNTSEDVVVRSSPGKVSKFYARRRGEKEFEIDHMSSFVTGALREAKEITKREYIDF